MERAANPWDRFYRFHEAPWRGERPVKDLLPLLEDGPVLELGCGNGKLLGPLVRAGVDVVGLDISYNVLSRLDHGARVLSDAAVLPFRDAVFAAVLDIHCTGHLLASGRAAAVQEVARVLRPGGHVVVERLAPDDLRAGQGEDAGEPWTRRLQDGRTTHFSAEEDLAAEWGQALQVVSVTLWRQEQRLRGADAVRATIRALCQKAG